MTTKNSNLEDYFRPHPVVSRRAHALLHISLCAAAFFTLVSMVLAQYPGRITKSGQSTSTLRSVAVLEWTGDPGSPTASRLVPISVYDGEQLNDGGLYLNRPEPLALAAETEYELQSGGKAIRLFDVFDSGQVFRTWQGTGAVKPLPVAIAPKAATASGAGSSPSEDTSRDDRPMLKSDKPILNRKAPEDTDADRPTLGHTRKSKEAEMADSSSVAPDAERPHLKHGKPADLDRTEPPRLDGMPADLQQAVAVSDASRRAEHLWKYTWANPGDEVKMRQSLEAIARKALGLDTRPASSQPAGKSPAQASSQASATRRKNSMLHSDSSAERAPGLLADESFHAFELGYGATATLVLTAASSQPAGVVAGDDPDATKTIPQPDETPFIKRGKPDQAAGNSTTPALSAKAAPQKVVTVFVTLIAQPDLYGGVHVLLKSTTDSAHLDQTPRMRLIDAVDAMGDNRGELLFELRGSGQRQFGLYRILRGSVEQLFATADLP